MVGARFHTTGKEGQRLAHLVNTLAGKRPRCVEIDTQAAQEVIDFVL